MRKKILLGVSTFILGGLLFAGLTGVQAYQGNSSSSSSVPKLTSEQRTAINTAIANGDYTTWKSLVGNEAVTQKINQSNFAQYSQAYNLMSQAQAIYKNLGVGMGGRMGAGMMGGSKLTADQKTSLNTAITNGDYNTWKSIMGSNPITQKITAANFSQYVQAQNLMKAGNKTGAQAIYKQLGIGFGGGFARGRQKGATTSQSAPAQSQ